MGAAILILSCIIACSARAQTRALSTLSPFAVAKARTLMANRLPCFGCHQLDGTGGHVGPDLTNLAKRRSAEYVARIVDDPQSVVPGTAMPRTPMSPQMRALVLAALLGTTPDKVPASRASLKSAGSNSQRGDGAPLYGRYCAACHGSGGAGDGPNARYLPIRPAAHRDATAMSLRTDDRLFDAIYAGGYPLGKSAAMPAFGATLTRGEVWSIVGYLRVLCRCAPPTWSTDGVRSPPSLEKR